MSTYNWLREHPRCSLALCSEYGDLKPLDAPKATQQGGNGE